MTEPPNNRRRRGAIIRLRRLYNADALACVEALRALLLSPAGGPSHQEDPETGARSEGADVQEPIIECRKRQEVKKCHPLF